METDLWVFVNVPQVVFVIEDIRCTDGNHILILVPERPTCIEKSRIGRILVVGAGPSACKVVPAAPQLVNIAMMREEQWIAGRVPQTAHVVPWQRRQSNINVDNAMRVIFQTASRECVAAESSEIGEAIQGGDAGSGAVSRWQIASASQPGVAGAIPERVGSASRSRVGWRQGANIF